MRPAIISFFSAAGFAIGGWVVPIVFPHVEPWVAKYMLLLAVFLLLTAAALWLSGYRRSATDGGTITQRTNGPLSPNLSGTFNGPVTIGERAPQERSWGSGPIITPLGPMVESILQAKGRAIRDAQERSTKPKPDLSLADLVPRVCHALGPVPEKEAEKKEFWVRVNLAIADKVVGEELQTWGRIGERALSPIDIDNWRHGIFDHKDGSLSVPVAYNTPYSVIDLHFSKLEIAKNWPELKEGDDG